MVAKHIKRCSVSYVIRELLIKTIMSFYTPIRIAKIKKKKNLTIPNADRDVEKWELPLIAGGNAK